MVQCGAAPAKAAEISAGCGGACCHSFVDEEVFDICCCVSSTGRQQAPEACDVGGGIWWRADGWFSGGLSLWEALGLHTTYTSFVQTCV